jgi:hypothetical protein
MATCDYRLCDICNNKVFYDANLNYEQGRDAEARYAKDCHYALENLGAWIVLCRDCAKSYDIAAVKRESAREQKN